MEKVLLNSDQVVPVRLIGDHIRYYCLTSPVAFYTSERQTKCYIERGFHVDTRLLPFSIRFVIKPDTPLGAIGLVYTKLLESPYLFDEIQQKPIRISREHCHAIVAAVIDQFQLGRVRSSWLKWVLWWGSVYQCSAKDGFQPNESKIKLEQEWRETHPPKFSVA